MLLQKNAKLISRQKVLVGLDGFVDEIVSVVDKRESPFRFTRVETIAALGDRISESAGKSAGIELVVKRVKLGGNGPIMANALAQIGARTTYLGAVGFPRMHDVFRPLSARARILSVCEPGHTDALEFADGKIMLGKHAPLHELTWATLCARAGKANVRTLLNESALLAMTNWAMVPAMTDIWRHLQREICPRLNKNAERLLFIDLADPTKRGKAELLAALKRVASFQRWFRVTLGLNIKEACLVARALGCNPRGERLTEVKRTAALIAAKLKLDAVVVHSRHYAMSVSRGETAVVRSAYTAKPLISTGAGDHFNAGYCVGRVLKSSESVALQLGVATGSYYVRTGKSPTCKELIQFLKAQARAEG